MMFKRTQERWRLKNGEGKHWIEISGGDSTGGQGLRRAVAPSDDDILLNYLEPKIFPAYLESVT
jgi:hypothetical protein